LRTRSCDALADDVDVRTTVTLDDEVAAIAAQYAESRGLSLSKAIAELIVRATRRSARMKYVDGLPVCDLPKSKHPITGEQVKALEGVHTDARTLRGGRAPQNEVGYQCHSEKAGGPSGLH